MVIWATGLSGSGKSTLCDALYQQLKSRLPALVRLDGDEVRAAFGDDLAYAERDRHKQISRIQRIAKLLANQRIPVLVAALYAHPDLLAWNRKNLPGYFEIYIKAGLELLRQRDSKKLYSRAFAGEMTDVVGVDIPWHEPTQSDLVIDAASAAAPDILATQVISALSASSKLKGFQLEAGS